MCTASVWVVCVTAAAAQLQRPDWQTLDARAAALYLKGDLPQAIAAAEAALAVAGSPRESGKSLDRLGFLHYTAGKLTEGEKELRQSLQVREEAFGADSLDYAESAIDLAMALRDLRRMDEARTLASRSVAIRERSLGGGDLLLAESLDTLGTIQGLSGDYTEAVSTFERAAAIHEARNPESRASEEYGTLCVNLAGTYQRLGRYAIAETTFRKGLDALRVRPGTEHPAYAASLLAFAAFEVEIGKYSDAERLYDEGGTLLKSELGDQHPLYATVLNNRGALYEAIGNRTAAAADYQHSLDLKRKLYGPSSPQAASTLRNLAHLTYARDRAAGERLFAEAVEAYRQAANPPPFDFTSVLLGLGHAQRERQNLDAAAKTIQSAVDVARAGLGEHHPLYAAALRESGLIALARGDRQSARRTLEDALRVAIAAHGPTHPDIARFLDALGGLDVQEGDFAAAEAAYRKSLAITIRALADALEIGSEAFKLQSLANAVDPVPSLIAFQAVAGARLPESRALAFEAVTWRKGRVLEQVRGWRGRLSNIADGPLRDKAAAWQAMLECRTSLSVALGYRDLKPSVVGGCGLEGTDRAGKYERLLSDLRSRRSEDVAAKAVAAVADLTREGDALEASLNRSLGGLSADAAPVSADSIRARLRPGECLIEFVSYSADAGTTTSQRYGAFVVRSSGDVQWRDLGAARSIDAAVRDLLSAANDWSVSVGNHEMLAASASAKTAADAVQNLSRRVWMPLASLVAADSGIRRLRIAPDGMLDLVPFEALRDPRPLIDRFTITYLPAGRDLASESTTADPGGPSVIMVSPGAGARGSAAPSSASIVDRLPPIAAAVGEAEDVRRMIDGAELYGAGRATEHRLKELHGPLLLHIAGHGVIRAGGDDATTAGSSRQAMALSGIVMDEAYGRGGRSSEDGLLTPEELENLDLRGTQMVVLSQCRMADGVASIGEGVYGMRRAAAIAGARTFVAPLWNVDDAVERRLMRAFYSGLSAGLSRADALRRAKLSIRRTRPTRDFLYWAPVILSGAVDPLPSSAFTRR
jgi:CHAT domain-containing protein/tetratricopeptide (TPR) repeat protein